MSYALSFQHGHQTSELKQLRSQKSALMRTSRFTLHAPLRWLTRVILDWICTCNPSLNWSQNVFCLRTSRYIFYPEGMLFLHSFISGFGEIFMHVLPVPCTGKCVRREQTDCTVCSMPMDLPLRLECKERASHKPTGMGDEVSRRISSLHAIVSSPRSEMPGTDDRRRKHMERMLARARKRSRQAQKIVAKWGGQTE